MHHSHKITNFYLYNQTRGFHLSSAVLRRIQGLPAVLASALLPGPHRQHITLIALFIEMGSAILPGQASNSCIQASLFSEELEL